MQLGMFMQPMHDPKKPWLQMLREDQDAVVLADELGFSECWIGEHFSSVPEMIPSPLMFLATLIERTKNIKLGTGVINLPQHHPVQVAAFCAQFDQLSEGRFMMGIGTGGLLSDFEVFGLQDLETRVKMSREAIRIIHEIWASDPPYKIEGEFWSVDLEEMVFPELGIGTMPKPYQKPYPPLAMSVLSPNSGTARGAGAMGYIPISANFLQARHVKTHWDVYREGAEKAGRPADPNVWRVARSILVTDSDQEARDHIATPDTGLSFYYKYLLAIMMKRGSVENWRHRAEDPDEIVNVPYVLDNMVISGSPKTVLDKLIAFRDEVGHFGTLTMCAHDWDDVEFWRRSMRLLAEEVMPKLTQHADATMPAE